MKKSVKIIALALVAVMLCMALVSCGKKLSGTYSAEFAGTGVTYEFKGSKVTVSVKALGAEVTDVEGKYSIDGDKITFEFDDEKGDVESGTFDFEKTEDGIKIGLVEYKKK